MSVLISVCTRESIHAQTINWMLRSGHAIDIVQTYQTIDFNRNQQVKNFLESEHDHIFFLDSDAVPVRGTIEVLLDYGKDIALVPNMLFDQGLREFKLMAFNDAEKTGTWSLSYPDDETGFREISGSGMSGVLVKREVFETLKAPWFRFIHAKDGRLLLGEDVYFYRKARKAGYKVWCEFALPQQHFKTVDLKKAWEGQRQWRQTV